MNRLFGCILVLGLLVSGSFCFAQLDTATILGTVFDKSGAVIPGSTVAIQNVGTSATVNLKTSADGSYVAPVLPIGTYRITFSAPGFKTLVRESIALSVSDRLRIDVTLETGQISDTVTVTGETPLVEAASSTLGGVIGKSQVNELPLNGRSLAALMSVAPGTVMLAPASYRSMNGASQGRLFDSGTRYLVDGGDSGQVDSDLIDSAYASGARITRASVDAIEEIRVQESSFSAEFGQAMGGVVNFVTKSGANKFHGNVFEYFRNEVLDSRNYFNVAPAQKPPFRLNQFGGALSGPIIRDRLFFFVNYEGVRQRLGIAQNSFVPTQAFRDTLPVEVRVAVSQLPPPNGEVSPAEPRLARFRRSVSNQLTEDTGSVKVDWLITEKDRFSARYNNNHSYTQSWFGVGTEQYRPVPSMLQTAKLTYTRTIQPSLLNEAGFALNRMHTDPLAGGSDVLRSSPIVPSIAGMAAMGPALFDMLVANTSFTYQDTVSWVKGHHSLKFGAQIVRNQDNKAVNFQKYLIFLSLNDLARNFPFLAMTLGWPRQGLRNTYNHFFVQDDIQVTPRLTINAGLRYQYDTATTEAYDRIANFNPATGKVDPAGTPIFNAPKTNFGPRVGLAWTPFNSKQTVIRMGYGIFHSAFMAVAAQYHPSNVPGFAQNATKVFPGVGFPFPPIQPAPDGTGSNLWAIPYDYQAPYTQHWNLNIQQGIGKTTMVQVGYVGNRGLHLNPYNELNLINPATGQRKWPKYGTISNFFNGGISSYNSLQASVRQRFAHGFAFNANYTWAHTLDIGGVNFGTVVSNSNNVRGDYGNADYDVRHVLQFDYTYQVPAIPKLPALIGKGWQLNGLTVMRSGLPINVVCGCDPLGDGTAAGRVDVVPGVDPRPPNFDIPNNYLNIAAFKAPKSGTVGNLARNAYKGPAAFNWDFSIFKNFPVREGQNVQFRAELFNLFNTPQFSNPGASIAAPATFGKIFSTIPAVGGFGSNRQIQFALRYSF